MKRITLLSLVLFPMFVMGQIADSLYDLNLYKWEKVPDTKIPGHIKAKDQAVLQYTLLIQQDFNEEDNLVAKKVIHQRVWIGDEKIVEDWNRLYFPLDEGDETVRIQARVIQPDGKILSLQEDDIKEGKDEDSERTYKYFALQGVQPGAVVEWLFHTIEGPSYLGTRHTFQKDIPVYDVHFEFVSPWNLVYRFKGYNGLPEVMQIDSMLKKENRWVVQIDSIEELKEERMADRIPHLMSVVYAMDKNTYNGKKDISSFAFASRNIFNNVNVELSKSEKKALEKVLKESKALKEDDPVRRVFLLESYVKGNYYTLENAGGDLSSIGNILDNKVMSVLGALRMYHHLLELAEIEHEIVMTCDKSVWPFDPEFEHHLSIQEPLIYVNEGEVFIDPVDNTSRLGFFTLDYQDTDGLFISGIDLGEGPIGVGEVRRTGHTKAEDSFSELTIDWKLEPDGDGEIKATRSHTGFQAKGFQSIARFIPEDKEKEFSETILKSMYPESEFESYEVENLETDAFGDKPLIATATFSDEAYLEHGANSIVVNVGQIIGPQSEWYQTDSVRHLPLSIGFPRTYHHVITMEIPEGYELKNLENLDMEVTSGGDDPIMLFKATHTMKDNVLTIEINEWYKRSEMPKEMIDEYRRVINAAADFNKKYLILQAVEG